MHKSKNDNYAAVVVEIKTLLPLAGCDFVQAAIIMGNQVIVSKETKVGDIGLYFPLETQLSEDYLSKNNLYRKPELNLDQTQKGYFEENGRIRCIKFRQNKSEGLFMPIESVQFAGELHFNLNDTFDEINGIEICRKYVIKHNHTPCTPGSKKDKKMKHAESKLVENQFRFHQNTSMLYKNLHRIKPESLISITYKIHGTSGISSKILCKKQLKWYEKFYKWLGINVVDTTYDYIYSSRRVIKNEELNSQAEHFYNENIWLVAHNELKDFLLDGMTFYYEIAGFLPTGGAIQKDYDYGCNPESGAIIFTNAITPRGEHKIFIYRITYTNLTGKVFEFTAKQVQQFCKKNGLNAIPEMFYGFAKEFSDERLDEDHWQTKFLETIKSKYNDKDCFLCKTRVPEEGVVIRIEALDFEAYKQKSNRFYERETKLLDQGVEDIENIN